MSVTFQTTKDPNSNLDYEIDWSLWLAAGDTIIASTWTADTGITVGTETFGTATATAWVTGGTVGEVYVVTNRITTAANRIDDRSIEFTIVEK